MVVLDGIRNTGQAGLHDETALDLGLMTPSTRPSPIRILSALERQPGAWIRTGPRSIEHAGLRVRLTLGIVSVRIAHVIPDADPVPIQAEPATRPHCRAAGGSAAPCDRRGSGSRRHCAARRHPEDGPVTLPAAAQGVEGFLSTAT